MKKRLKTLAIILTVIALCLCLKQDQGPTPSTDEVKQKTASGLKKNNLL